MYVCTFSNSYRVMWPQVGGGGVDKIQGGVHGGGSGGAASAPSIHQDHNNSNPHFHPTPTPIPEEQMDVEEHEQKSIIEKPIHVTEGEDIVLQVWELRHCPQKIQGGHGFPYKGRAHKEGPTVLLLCLKHLQFRFPAEAREGAQVGPYLWGWGGCKRLRPH